MLAAQRFTTALQQFDEKYGVTPKAQNLDQKYGVTEKASTGWSSLSSYFEKAKDTPTGQRLLAFYQTGTKQVLDVHAEARRLADLRAPKSTPEQVPGTNKTKCNCAADSGKCGCEPGNCACGDCALNPEVKPAADPEKANMQPATEGSEKTKCDCGGATGSCSCEAGKCACAR